LAALILFHCPKKHQQEGRKHQQGKKRKEKEGSIVRKEGSIMRKEGSICRKPLLLSLSLVALVLLSYQRNVESAGK